jgi:imidazolonepropionase-like amidohydrolase
MLSRAASLFVLLLSASFVSVAEMETRTPNGIKDDRLSPTALVNGTVVVKAGNERRDAVLLLKEGRIEGIVSEAPDGYRIVDLNGAYVYPGLIDFHTHYGMPEVGPGAANRWSGPEVLHSTSENATNANEAIKSHLNASDIFRRDEAEAEKLRELGFAAVLSSQPDGIARGTSAAILTGDNLVNEKILKNRVATHYSFDKGSSKQFYPISRMGVVSLLRQTEMDANWFANQTPRPFADVTLEAYTETDSLPKVMTAFDWKTLLLSDRIGDDMGHQDIIKGGGDEYQRVNEVKQTGATVIVGVDFPQPPDVMNSALAEYVTLRQLKHWELAPFNLAYLAQAGVPFVITSSGAEKDFWKNLKLAVKNGLSPEVALRALTETPAELMSLTDEVGSLEDGRIANLVVSSGPLFATQSRIVSTWVRGQKYQVAPAAQLLPGSYQLSLEGAETVSLDITQTKNKLSAKAADKAVKVKLTVYDDLVSLVLTRDGQAARGDVWLIDGSWQGNGQSFSGEAGTWQLTQTAGEVADTSQTESASSEPGELIFPFVAHGLTELPKAETILIQNATLWTNEEEGIVENTDLVIRDGKISKIGLGLTAGNATVINGEGLHLTPGIIDEHSHIALDGVNDFATNSSMVRMSDVVDSEDVGIYRALAGGVTSAQLLHGSANPIGGQSALIKMRWGSTPEEMLIEDAPKFIKFALGENVKRSSNRESLRYPQTRMGVEQVYVDAFNEAKLYEAKWQAYNDLPRRKRTAEARPRQDLRMDAMVEILNGERFVTSHSYVQSEINMLMRVAEQFDFRINTFTHILEGYKVADKMAEHGVGGSTFSDWWAYKWEVRYSIPYNAALMHQAGVVTAINSDDAEMLRRLNQEAAKSVRHGGVSEEDALKMVTLNPAKLLHLDDRMGSLAVGKDADVVLWDGNPLSVYSRPLTTIVDGKIYFDRARDEALQAGIKAERERLIQKVLTMNGGSGKLSGAPPEPGRLYYSHDVLHQMMDQAIQEIEEMSNE